MRAVRTFVFFLGATALLPTLVFGSQSQQMPWPNPQTSSSAQSTGSAKEAVNIVKQNGISYLNDHLLNATNRPAWLTRTDISYDIQQKNTPVAAIETIQPLFENRWSTFFWQGRAAYNSGSGIGNLGLGYRYLTDNKNLMWGLNTFYDESFQYQHKRIGVGGEIFTPFVTFRANYYDAISRTKNVGTSASGIISYERALSGYDASIETPVPYVPWMRFTAKGYHWTGHQASNVNGGQAGLRMFAAKQLEVDAGVAYDNSQHGKAFLAANYYFGGADFIEHTAMNSHSTSMFASQDLENMRLEKVIRNNNIIIEKTTSGSSGGIIIARGD